VGVWPSFFSRGEGRRKKPFFSFGGRVMVDFHDAISGAAGLLFYHGRCNSLLGELRQSPVFDYSLSYGLFLFSNGRE
jgi:hypothetical protein